MCAVTCAHDCVVSCPAGTCVVTCSGSAAAKKCGSGVSVCGVACP
jgi:hypothetical protein